MDKSVDKNLELPQTNKLYSEVCWIANKIDYSKLQFGQLQAENQRILNTLKVIQGKINAELKNKNTIIPRKPVLTQNVKALQQKIKNNEKLIEALNIDCKSADQRKGILNNGLESKTIQEKYSLEASINKLKLQIRQLKLQENESNKKLQTHHDLRPEGFEEHLRMEQQLRVISIKYVRLLQKYNRSSEQVALASKVELPDFQIPEDIYDKQLEQREEAQYKQYEGIVKLCNILSRRNDSEHNKAHRQYTIKLKELEKTIMKLAELDQAITSRQGELIQSKKNIEMLKVRLNNEQKLENRAMRLSQGSIPTNPIEKNYSSSKLLPNISNKQRIGQTIEVKNEKALLRNRGYSLSKIKGV